MRKWQEIDKAVRPEPRRRARISQGVAWMYYPSFAIVVRQAQGERLVPTHGPLYVDADYGAGPPRAIGQYYYSERSEISASANFQLGSEYAYNTAIGSKRFEIETEAEAKGYAEKLTTISGLEVIGPQLNSTGPDRHDNWVKDIENNPRMIGFTQDAFTPIWELCQKQSRAKELKYHYFTAHVPKAELWEAFGGFRNDTGTQVGRNYPTAYAKPYRIGFI